MGDIQRDSGQDIPFVTASVTVEQCYLLFSEGRQVAKLQSHIVLLELEVIMGYQGRFCLCMCSMCATCVCMHV